MTTWRKKVNVRDIFQDEEMPLADKAKKIVERLKPATDPNDHDIQGLLEELVDAGAEGDVDWFDGVWNFIYDWADANRVWIEAS